MSYPILQHKHKEKALFDPIHYVEYKKFPKNLPKKYILIYHDIALKHFQRKYHPRKVRLYSLLSVFVHKDMGLVKMSGIGSPLSGAILEELIALGGRYFLNIGTAGGLHGEGIYLCTKALRDEGTSYHYIPHGKFSYPDERLTRQLRVTLKKLEIPFQQGATWTIDAPYRETQAEVKKYSKLGIATVEMEASALFAVAQYRKVKIASLFVVSDLLGKKWLPKFHRFDVKKSQRMTIDAGVNCLRKIK